MCLNRVIMSRSPHYNLNFVIHGLIHLYIHTALLRVRHFIEWFSSSAANNPDEISFALALGLLISLLQQQQHHQYLTLHYTKHILLCRIGRYPTMNHFPPSGEQLLAAMGDEKS